MRVADACAVSVCEGDGLCPLFGLFGGSVHRGNCFV